MDICLRELKAYSGATHTAVLRIKWIIITTYNNILILEEFIFTSVLLKLFFLGGNKSLPGVLQSAVTVFSTVRNSNVSPSSNI